MSESWYFVRRLRPHERTGTSERFEIQVLGDDGLAIAVGYVGDISTTLVIDGHEVPMQVIEAARRCEEGGGNYVDARGSSRQPF